MPITVRRTAVVLIDQNNCLAHLALTTRIPFALTIQRAMDLPACLCDSSNTVAHYHYVPVKCHASSPAATRRAKMDMGASVKNKSKQCFHFPPTRVQLARCFCFSSSSKNTKSSELHTRWQKVKIFVTFSY